MPTRVTLDAPEDCVTRQALLTGVRARSERVKEAEPTEPAFQVEVTVRQAKGRVTATFRLTDLHGQRAPERRISTSTCDDARDALALVMAVALDPEAALNGQAPSKPSSPPLTVLPEPRRVPPPRAHPSERAPANLSLGGLVVGTVGPAPEALLGAGVFLHERFRISPTWPVALRVAAAYSWRQGLPVASARADFAQAQVALQLCPWAPDTGRLQVAGCASASVERLGARGHEVPNARSDVAWGGSAGLALLFGWHSRGSLSLELPIGATVPFARRSYQFQPEVFYQAARVSFTAGFGAAWAFR